MVSLHNLLSIHTTPCSHAWFRPSHLLSKLCLSQGFCPNLSLNILSSMSKLIKAATFLTFRSHLRCHLLLLREAFPVRITKGSFPPVNLYHLPCFNFLCSTSYNLLLSACFYIRTQVWKDRNLSCLIAPCAPLNSAWQIVGSK